MGSFERDTVRAEGVRAGALQGEPGQDGQTRGERMRGIVKTIVGFFIGCGGFWLAFATFFMRGGLDTPGKLEMLLAWVLFALVVLIVIGVDVAMSIA